MSNKETDITEKYFSKYNYNNSEDNFYKTNQNLLGLKSENLENGFNEIKIFNETTDYQISKEGRYIKIGSDILPDLDSIQMNVDKNLKNPFFDELITLNKIIYKDDLTSILNVAAKDKDLASDIVVLFNYEKSEPLFQTTIRSIENWEDITQNYKLALVFYNNKTKPLLREKLLKMLQTKEAFFYKLTFYIADNQKKISLKNGIPQGKLDEALAYMLNIGFKDKNDLDIQTDKSYLLLNNIYISHPDLLKTFEKNKYYNYKELKKYSEDYKLMQVDNQEKNYGIIQDSDGYTNLRKEKNSTSEILQKIKTGEKVEVLDYAGDWLLIVSKEGLKGYVYKTKIKSE